MKTIVKFNNGLYVSDNCGLRYTHIFYDIWSILKYYDYSIDYKPFRQLSITSVCVALSETEYTINCVLASDEFDFNTLTQLPTCVTVKDIFTRNNRVNVLISIAKPTHDMIYECQEYDVDREIKQDDIQYCPV